MKLHFVPKHVIRLMLVIAPVSAALASTGPSGTRLVEIIHLMSMQEETRTFNVSNFDRLNLGSAFTINVTQGNSFKVTATGRQEDLADLEANVSGDELRVRYKDKNWWNQNRQRVTISITMPAVRAIKFSGATRSTVTGFKAQKTLDLNVSGASTSTIDVNTEQLNVDFSGASNITLTGQTRRLEGEVSGATTLRAYDCKVSEALVDVSGASSARVNVTGSLNARASGASNVSYKGSAKVVSNTSGASSIREAN